MLSSADLRTGGEKRVVVTQNTEFFNEVHAVIPNIIGSGGPEPI